MSCCKEVGYMWRWVCDREGHSHRSQHLETGPFLTSNPCHQSANQPLIHLWATWIIPPLLKSWLVKHVLLLNEPGVLATVTNQSMKPINLSGKNQFPRQSIRPIWGQYIMSIYQANLPRHLLGQCVGPNSVVNYWTNLSGPFIRSIIKKNVYWILSCKSFRPIYWAIL